VNIFFLCIHFVVICLLSFSCRPDPKGEDAVKKGGNGGGDYPFYHGNRDDIGDQTKDSVPSTYVAKNVNKGICTKLDVFKTTVKQHLDIYGCNQCHKESNKLVLSGVSDEIACNNTIKRADFSAPDNSSILQYPTNPEKHHPGGVKFKLSDDVYKDILRWIFKEAGYEGDIKEDTRALRLISNSEYKNTLKVVFDRDDILLADTIGAGVFDNQVREVNHGQVFAYLEGALDFANSVNPGSMEEVYGYAKKLWARELTAAEKSDFEALRASAKAVSEGSGSGGASKSTGVSGKCCLIKGKNSNQDYCDGQGQSHYPQPSLCNGNGFCKWISSGDCSSAKISTTTTSAVKITDHDRKAFQVVLAAILNSPNFLYRTEYGVKQSDGSYKLTPDELADSLYFFLYGRKDIDGGFKAKKAKFTSSAGIKEVVAVELDKTPKPPVYKRFVEFLAKVHILENNSASNGLTGKSAIIAKAKNEPGDFITQVLADSGDQYKAFWSKTPSQLAQVGELGKSLITQAAFLGIYASSAGPNEIKRGANFINTFLCRKLTPPPNVNDLFLEADKKVGSDKHTREGRAGNSNCSGCHVEIDGVGYAFGTKGGPVYDQTGKRVSSSDVLAGKIKLDGKLQDFKGIESGLLSLVQSSVEAKKCFVKRWFEFAFGRSAESAPVERIFTEFTKTNKLRDLVLAIVSDRRFLLRTKK
jgi:hypothetical protein